MHGRKNMLLSIVVFGLILTTCAVIAQDTPRDAIELYFQAHASGNGDFIGQAFTPEARIEFVDNGELKQWTREEFANRFHGAAADEYRRVRSVERLDVNATAASAVLTLDYPDVVLTDHVSLLKVSGVWKIVNKIFSADRRNRAQEDVKDTLKNWSQPFEPRRIIANIYYVGSNLISSFLIVTPAGHILIDTGHVQMLPQVEANIEKLGVKVKDVKILLTGRVHAEPCGGLAEVERQTGATVIASKRDGDLMM